VNHRPKMMLFSHICSSAYITGAEKLLLMFARELQSMFRCTLVVPQDGVLAGEARAAGLQVEILDLPLLVELYSAEPNLLQRAEAMRLDPSWSGLQQLLQGHRPDCVWVNTCVHPMPAMAAKSLGIPTVWAMMETIADTPFRAEATEIISRYSDRLIGISGTTLSPFSREILDAKRAVVLPPYVDREEYHPNQWSVYRTLLRRNFNWSEEHRVVGMIAATFYPNKGVREFLNAVLPIAAGDPRVRVLLAGNPMNEVYSEECRSLVEQSGLADRVQWLGFTERVEQVYPAMDVVVVPSLMIEGFGMTALEGMMFGKPVITFAAGGLQELLLSTGNEGLLVPLGDVAGLSGKIAGLVQDDALRFTVGQRNMGAAGALYGYGPFRRRLAAFAAELPVDLEPMSPLVRGSGPTVFLLENGFRRPFPSEEIFRERGFRFEDVRSVTDEELDSIPLGSPMEPLPRTTPSAGIPVTVPAPRKKRKRSGRRRRAGRRRSVRKRASARRKPKSRARG